MPIDALKTGPAAFDFGEEDRSFSSFSMPSKTSYPTEDVFTPKDLFNAGEKAIEAIGKKAYGVANRIVRNLKFNYDILFNDVSVIDLATMPEYQETTVPPTKEDLSYLEELKRGENRWAGGLLYSYGNLGKEFVKFIDDQYEKFKGTPLEKVTEFHRKLNETIGITQVSKALGFDQAKAAGELILKDPLNARSEGSVDPKSIHLPYADKLSGNVWYEDVYKNLSLATNPKFLVASFGEQAPGMALSVATWYLVPGTKTAKALAGAIPWGIVSANGAYEDTVKILRDEGYDEETQRMWGLIGGVTAGIGSTILEVAQGKIFMETPGADKIFAGGIMKGIMKLLSQGGQESLIEMAQTSLERASVYAVTKNPKAFDNYIQELSLSGQLAFMMSVPTSAVSSAMDFSSKVESDIAEARRMNEESRERAIASVLSGKEISDLGTFLSQVASNDEVSVELEELKTEALAYQRDEDGKAQDQIQEETLSFQKEDQEGKKINHRNRVRREVSKAYGNNIDLAQQVTALTDSYASAWAKATGKDVQDYYKGLLVERVTKASKEKGISAEDQKNAMGMHRYFQGMERAIYILRKGNESTILHELAHDFMQFLPEISQDLASDVAKILGKEKFIDALNDEVSIETFARSFEVYAAKGVAPSASLKIAFEKFKTWISDFVGSWGESLRKLYNPELEKVFNKIFNEGEKAQLSKKINDTMTAEAVGKVLEDVKASDKKDQELDVQKLGEIAKLRATYKKARKNLLPEHQKLLDKLVYPTELGLPKDLEKLAASLYAGEIQDRFPDWEVHKQIVAKAIKAIRRWGGDVDTAREEGREYVEKLKEGRDAKGRFKKKFRALEKLSLDELVDFRNGVETLMLMSQTKHRLRTERIGHERNKVVKGLSEELLTRKTQDDSSTDLSEWKKTGVMSRIGFWDLLSPETKVALIFQEKGKETFVKAVMDANEAQASLQHHLEDKLRDGLKLLGLDEGFDAEMQKPVEISLLNAMTQRKKGLSVKMTRGERIQLLLTLKDSHARRSLARKEGIVFRRKKGASPIRFGASDIKTLENPEIWSDGKKNVQLDMQIADVLFNVYNDEKLQGGMREAGKKTLYVDIVKRSDYVPMQRDLTEKLKNFDSYVRAFLEQHLIDQDIIQARKENAKSPIVIGDAFDTVVSYISRATSFAAKAPVAADLMTILKDPKIIRAFSQIDNGKYLLEDFREFVQYWEGLDFRHHGTYERLANKIIHGAHFANLALKPAIVMYQKVSILTAFGYINPKYYRPLSPTKYLSVQDQASASNPILRSRFDGTAHAVLTPEAASFHRKRAIWGKRSAYESFTLGPIHAMDTHTILEIFQMAQREGIERGRTGQDLDIYAGKRTVEIIAKSQPSWDALTISTMHRNAVANPVLKLVIPGLLYSSQRSKDFNMVVEKNIEYQRSDKSLKSKKALLYGIAAPTVLNALLVALIGDFGEKIFKKEHYTSYPDAAMEVVGRLLGNWVGAGDVANAIIQTYVNLAKGDTMAAASSAARPMLSAEMFANISTGIGQMIMSINDAMNGTEFSSGPFKGEKKWTVDLYRGSEDLMRAVSIAMGLPVGGVLQISDRINPYHLRGEQFYYDMLWDSMKYGRGGYTEHALKMLVQKGRKWENIRSSAKTRGIKLSLEDERYLQGLWMSNARSYRPSRERNKR